MKNKDTLLLEAAYSKMYTALTPDGPEANEPGHNHALTPDGNEVNEPGHNHVLAPDGPNKGSDVSEETTAKYYEMWNKFKEGNIDEQEWQSFCVDLLGDLMEANKDVFVRLKNR